MHERASSRAPSEQARTSRDTEKDRTIQTDQVSSEDTSLSIKVEVWDTDTPVIVANHDKAIERFKQHSFPNSIAHEWEMEKALSFLKRFPAEPLYFIVGRRIYKINNIESIAVIREWVKTQLNELSRSIQDENANID